MVAGSTIKIRSLSETKGLVISLVRVGSTLTGVICYAYDVCCVRVCKLICLPSRFSNDTLVADMDDSTDAVR